MDTHTTFIAVIDREQGDRVVVASESELEVKAAAAALGGSAVIMTNDQATQHYIVDQYVTRDGDVVEVGDIITRRWFSIPGTEGNSYRVEGIFAGLGHNNATLSVIPRVTNVKEIVWRKTSFYGWAIEAVHADDDMSAAESLACGQ